MLILGVTPHILSTVSRILWSKNIFILLYRLDIKKYCTFNFQYPFWSFRENSRGSGYRYLLWIWEVSNFRLHNVSWCVCVFWQIFTWRRLLNPPANTRPPLTRVPPAAAPRSPHCEIHADWCLELEMNLREVWSFTITLLVKSGY